MDAENELRSALSLAENADEHESPADDLVVSGLRDVALTDDTLGHSTDDTLGHSTDDTLGHSQRAVKFVDEVEDATAGDDAADGRFDALCQRQCAASLSPCMQAIDVVDRTSRCVHSG